MPIIIVMGPSCAGKSTFIKKYFKDYKVIDLFDFQTKTRPTFDSVWESYVNCANALKECIKQGNKNIILEHTLLKRIRREWYISQIREVTNEDIEIYCLIPSIDQLIERSYLRHIAVSKEEAEEILNAIEIPIKEEGYSKVKIVRE